MSEKGKKLLTKDNLLIVVLCGVLILIALWPVDKRKQMSNTNTSVAENAEQTKGVSSYRMEMQEELERMLQQMEGVGKVHVMITMKQSEETKVQNALWGNERETIAQEPRVEGLLVLAQGAANAKVREDITETAKALFDVEANKVKVAVLKTGGY